MPLKNSFPFWPGSRPGVRKRYPQDSVATDPAAIACTIFGLRALHQNLQQVPEAQCLQLLEAPLEASLREGWRPPWSFPSRELEVRLRAL